MCHTWAACSHGGMAVPWSCSHVPAVLGGFFGRSGSSSVGAASMLGTVQLKCSPVLGAVQCRRLLRESAGGR